MRFVFYFLFLYLFSLASDAQTLNWNTAARTGSAPNYTYTGTGIKAVITSNALTFGDGTPRVDGASGNSACYLNPGLAMYAGFFNSYTAATNAHITTTFSFAGGYGCSDVTIIIKDINSDESFSTFCDVLEISATYGNSGTALPAANITTTLASNVNRSVSGTTVKLVGHSSSTETIGSYSTGSACGNTTVKFAAPAGNPLKTMTIKYRPAYGSSTSNAYYNVNPRPAAQFVSMGNLSFVATSGCTQLLPVELISFEAKRNENEVKLDWRTAMEKNNSHFQVERSGDGINFEIIEEVKGRGNSAVINYYNVADRSPLEGVSYYRLKQVDYDEKFKYSEIVSVEEPHRNISISNVFPNPTSSMVNFDFSTSVRGELNYDITDVMGRVLISKREMPEYGKTTFTLSLNDLPAGIYYLNIVFEKTNFSSFTKIAKNLD